MILVCEFGVHNHVQSAMIVPDSCTLGPLTGGNLLLPPSSGQSLFMSLPTSGVGLGVGMGMNLQPLGPSEQR